MPHFIFLYIFPLTVFIVMHLNTTSNCKNYLARNVILIGALVCPSYMPGQYTVQTQIVVGGVYQKKHLQCSTLPAHLHSSEAWTSSTVFHIFWEHLFLGLSHSHVFCLHIALACLRHQQCSLRGSSNMHNIITPWVQCNIHIHMWITEGNNKKV